MDLVGLVYNSFDTLDIKICEHKDPRCQTIYFLNNLRKLFDTEYYVDMDNVKTKMDHWDKLFMFIEILNQIMDKIRKTI